jgi:hypothetical protein
MVRQIRVLAVASVAATLAIAPAASATRWHGGGNPSILAAGGETTVALDAGAGAALQSLGVAVAPLGTATAGPSGIAFPITVAKLDGKTLAGRIGHTGGLTFSKGSTKVDLRRFTIKISDKPALSGIAAVNGKVVGRLDLFSLDLSKLKVDRTDEQLTLSGVTLKLTKGAADALNGSFGVTAFTEGLTIGSATADTDIIFEKRPWGEKSYSKK